MRHDAELNQYSWFYTGGCFKGGNPVNYEELKPGELKNFKDVQFEVRLDHREWDQIPKSDEFTNDLDEKDGLQAETDEEKEARLQKESDTKVTEIEEKSEDTGVMYTIYQCFMGVSIIFFILGLVSIGALIYLFVNQKSGEETTGLINRGGAGGGDSAQYDGAAGPGYGGYNDNQQYAQGYNQGPPPGGQGRQMGTMQY